jgi:hypothetical protein
MTDTRYVYGATCTWNGPIQEAKGYAHRPPGCPFCGGVLFEAKSEQHWTESVMKYERDAHPGYRAFSEWLGRCGRCWSLGSVSLNDIARIYQAETGREVRL